MKSNNDVLIVVEEPAPTKVDPVVYAKPVNGSCGDVANRKLTQAPTESLCTTGDPTSVEEKDNTYSWTCMGKNGGWNASTCQAYKTEDGVCGSLANSIVPPKFNGFTKDKLCTVGFETMVTTVGQQLSWQCGGWFGGKNAMCYAIQAVDPNSVRSY
ncbi:MAG TPA: hypothetical protein VFQ72_01065 [Candidatus Paceibacterota bacterium]|nr:hypothetical protein [Candidatus Paceibacterota bacterium]